MEMVADFASIKAPKKVQASYDRTGTYDEQVAKAEGKSLTGFDNVFHGGELMVALTVGRTDSDNKPLPGRQPRGGGVLDGRLSRAVRAGERSAYVQVVGIRWG